MVCDSWEVMHSANNLFERKVDSEKKGLEKRLLQKDSRWGSCLRKHPRIMQSVQHHLFTYSADMPREGENHPVLSISIF